MHPILSKADILEHLSDIEEELDYNLGEAVSDNNFADAAKYAAQQELLERIQEFLNK